MLSTQKFQMCSICQNIEMTVSHLLFGDFLTFKFLEIMGKDTWEQENGDMQEEHLFLTRKTPNLEHLGEI